MTSGDQRVLVVTATADAHTRSRLAALADGRPLRFSTAPTLDDTATTAIVEDMAALAAADPADISRWVARGGQLLLLGAPPAAGGWSRLTGLAGARPLPSAEYVLSPDGDPLTARIDDEICVVDALAALEPRGAQILLTTLVGTRTIPVVTHHAVGDGGVTVAGVAGAGDVIRSPALTRVLTRALHRPEPRAPTLGVGIIGYGAFGYRHGSASEATPGLALTAVADADAARRAEAAEAFTDAAIHADAGALLSDDAVDVVVISTPPVSHADLATRALEAGLHVVVEKPLCLTAADADKLVTLATAQERVLTVHQNRRWDPDYLAIRRVVDDGLLGEVFNVETFVGTFEHPCRAWHSEVSVSGGAVYDWGAHHLDWVLQLLDGFPTTVQTTRHKRVWHDVTNADQLRVRLRWEDGREAEFVDSTLAAVRRPKFYIQGTRGTLVGHYRQLRTETVDPREGYLAVDHHHAEAPADLLLARHEPGLGISETRLALPTPPRHPFHRNLADHLILGEPLAVTAEQARRTVILLEAAHRSGLQRGAELPVAP